MAASFEPAVAGQVAQALGPMFALPITAPEAVDRFTAIGFDRDEWAERYFAFRSAQLGRATAETVIATYFNFAPLPDPSLHPARVGHRRPGAGARHAHGLGRRGDGPSTRRHGGHRGAARAGQPDQCGRGIGVRAPGRPAAVRGHREHSVAGGTARADLARHACAARVPRRRSRRGAHRQRPHGPRSAGAARGHGLVSARSAAVLARVAAGDVGRHGRGAARAAA